MTQHGVELALNRLATALGEELALDANGMITLELGHTACTIEVPRGSRHLYFSAPVQRVPATDAEATLRLALALNQFDLPIAGAFIGLDETSNQISLCRVVAVDHLQADGLSLILLEMVEAVSAVADRLRRSAEKAPNGAFHAPSASDMFLVRA